MKELIGTTLGQYEIREKIGQGGMAHVFKAYQASLDRFVAVKVLSPLLAEQPGFSERFQREAHSVARLLHPNVLQVYDFGIQDRYNYIVMRYVEHSRTLGDLIEASMPTDELLNYIIQVADALNYAHKRGVIHRDVKPSNILIDDDRWALLGDFGLVKMAGASDQLTGTGVGIGTPAYMSPEQAAGGKVDHRTDIYALGIILYKVLTGTIPHDATTPLAILVKRSMEPVTPLRQIRADLPPSLEDVILHSLATKPDARYSTAIDFADALKKAKADLSDQQTAGFDATIISDHKLPLPAVERRKKWGIIGGVAAALIVVGVFIYLIFQGSFGAKSTPPVETPVTVERSVSTIARTRLEVRSGPGAQYDLLGYLPAGAAAELLNQDETGSWWQIKTSLTGAGVGWIEADPVSVETINTDHLPIALAPPPPTATATATATHSPVPPTETPSPTPTPTPTNSPVPPTKTPTPQPTLTPTDTPTATSTRPPSAIAKTRLEVWSGPGAQYDLLGYLPVGAAAEVLSQDETGEWWQIRTSLAGAGVGWIEADPDSAETINTDRMPIALAPPTPTATATATPTHTPVPPTETPSPTPTWTPTNTPAPPTPTPTPSRTPTSTAIPSPTRTAIPSPTRTAIPSPTRTAIPSPTRTATATPTRPPVATPTPTPSRTPTRTPTVARPANTPTPPPPTITPAPTKPAIAGKLAFPVDNGYGRYDVYVVSMPDGQLVARLDGARQPHFHENGTKLLINGQGGGFGEDVFEANALTGAIERPVSGSPTDSHPVYNLGSQRIAYDNPQLAVGSDGKYHSYIFVQCSTVPPAQEAEETCRDIARFGVLVPAGQIGEIQGSNPVWTVADQIIYKGCNTWANGQSCGLFTVGSWANKRNSNGETPRKLADGTSLIPTDTKGNLVAFQSIESGDWEAYVMDLNGGGMINLSNSPGSNDGLPTLSPDGRWVAFASNRAGNWAVYVTPSSGGAATKLFDFPKSNPWGAGTDRDWTNERMSWGP